VREPLGSTALSATVDPERRGLGEIGGSGAPPASVLPNVWMSYPGLVFLIGSFPAVPSPVGPLVVHPGGAFISFNVPPGLSGVGGLFQGIVLAPGIATNGLHASTDAHERRIL
jgi:hypothetical protein